VWKSGYGESTSPILRDVTLFDKQAAPSSLVVKP
jgi:hypothetical protein